MNSIHNIKREKRKKGKNFTFKIFIYAKKREKLI